MRKPGEWMQLPTDNLILEALDKGLEIGPTAIARNIDKSQSTVHERLRVLIEYGLVEKVDDGYYTITDDGHAYLEGDLDAKDLEPSA
ncbi:IclR helix-turn-helix domain-containing protein [Natrinema salifodinae]|uniref:IclR helix-turn-helix domain-containing protein n=2 Tax=Natrinema salifodinae TaxID=1202768 RepID=A0A1I0M8M2_9EURY|nr:IclR helix-turn-helix domain-containing protein [Natrinema salifodinae]